MMDGRTGDSASRGFGGHRPHESVRDGSQDGYGTVTKQETVAIGRAQRTDSTFGSTPELLWCMCCTVCGTPNREISHQLYILRHVYVRTRGACEK